MKQQGQIILILILVMTVALGIGLSVIQKSLVDISTASKVEQSSRAFSAAEAGVEKVLANKGLDKSGQTFTGNSSSFQPVSDSKSIPGQQSGNSPQIPVVYPPLAKEDVVQIWLADPATALPGSCATGATCYKQSSLDVYWGNSSSDKAALELTLVYYGTDLSDPVDPSTTKYRSRKWYLDQNITRTPDNGFEKLSCFGGIAELLNLGNNQTQQFQCKKTITALPSGLMLLRARLLYNTGSQPLAVQAVGTCGSDCSLPSQAREIISTGTSGNTQRTVRLFQMNQVVPPFFDYAIFSAGEINK